MRELVIRWRLPVLFALAFAVAYGSVIASLIDAWSSNPLLSYGFAVPLISGFIVWTRRSEWSHLIPIPDYRLGVPIVLLGVGMLALGKVGALFSVQGVSLMVSLVGCMLVLFGRGISRVLWFPMAYLGLMLPIWHQPIAGLQVPSQLLSARIAGGLLHIAGVPTSLEGTLLVLPSVTLQVLRECSGVNQLIALVAMVLPVAYLWLRTFWRRAVLIGVAISVGYLSNGFRIALIGWLAAHGLAEPDPRAPLHVIQGLGVSVFGYVILGVCFSFLAKSDRKSHPDEATAARNSVPPAERAIRRHAWLDVALPAVLLLATSTQLFTSWVEVRPTAALDAVPYQVGSWETDWQAAPAGLPDVDEAFIPAYPGSHPPRRFVGVDHELIRAYRNQSGSQVQLYVGYYERQEEEREITGDVSRALHSIASAVPVPSPSGQAIVSEVVRNLGGRRRGLLFWYDVNGRITRSLYVAKALTIWNTLTRRRANAAVVMIRWADAGRGNAAEAAAVDFASVMMPVLSQHLPSDGRRPNAQSARTAESSP